MKPYSIVLILVFVIVIVDFIASMTYVSRMAARIKAYNAVFYQEVFPHGWFYQLFIGRNTYFYWRTVIAQLRANPDPVLQAEGNKLSSAFTLFMLPFGLVMAGVAVLFILAPHR